MKAVYKLRKLLRGTRGVATSLIEATATVAIGAVLAGVAVGSAINSINDSKIQAAIADVHVMGQAVITFYKDNAFFPLYQDGNETGPSDDFFFNLVSRNGTYPADTTGDTWKIAGAGTGYTENNAAGLFGHDLLATDDAIEGHLINNAIKATFDALTGLLSAGAGYPIRGQYPGDAQRGWAGPYAGVLTKADPWGSKYLINVRMLHTGNFIGQNAEEIPNADPNLNFPLVGVVVLSAGPDRAIDTAANQLGDVFTVNNDDIVFRIK